MDGLELARRIGARPVLAPTAVLLLTTGRAPDAHDLSGLGIGALVPKPVAGDHLHDEVLRLVTGTPPPAPLPHGLPLAPRVAAHPRGLPHDRGRVLVVEDNTTNQMVAMGLLSRLGFDVEVVSDGRQAVEAVAKTEYATVLMDCNMPVMDGYAATAAIRHLEAGGRPRVPIVAMTASALAGDRERCLAAGMDDYLAKPVTLQELDRVLSRWRPAGASNSVLAVIDGDQLGSLRALDGGDGVFFAALVESFLTSSGAFVRSLTAAAQDGDGAALGREAHRFKGEAATLGASGLAAMCAELERIADPFDAAEVAGVLHRIEEELERVRGKLRAEVAPV
jgi:two-component system sensor histidine kinase/response regulator